MSESMACSLSLINENMIDMYWNDGIEILLDFGLVLRILQNIQATTRFEQINAGDSQILTDGT